MSATVSNPSNAPSTAIVHNAEKPTSIPKEKMATDKDRMVKALKEALSGLGGNIFSSNIIFPMDVVKIRMQVPGCTYKNMFDGLSRIFNEEGLAALYTGLSSEILKSGTQTFIYFFAYSALKDYAAAVLMKRELAKLQEKQAKEAQQSNTNTQEIPKSLATAVKHQQLPILVNLLVGFVAGCITQIFVNPLSVIQTRIMTNKKAGGAQATVLSMAMKIIKEEGFTALYKGIIPTFILCINPAIQYLVFDNLKAYYKKFLYKQANSRNPNALENFFMGAISKVVATVSTYPYIMAKVRLQYKAKSGEPQYSGTLDVILKILSNDGVLGLFAGLQPQLFKSILSGALLLMAKEKIAEFVDQAIDLVAKRM